MAGVLDTVNQRTQLVGQNRLELLLFQLGNKQTYGINVFKVKEVIRCLPLTMIPKRNPLIRGLSHIRGHTLPIIDMSLAIGGQSVEKTDNSFIIITEYNLSIQGFLVHSVERIVNMHWEAIKPPPPGINSAASYLTAVTEIDGKLVEILDVEKILQEISPAIVELGERPDDVAAINKLPTKKVLIVDDSSVARNQVKRLLEQLGVEVIIRKNGREALDYLKSVVAEGKKLNDELFMIISDIEMPEMDGYTLTTEIRSNPDLKQAYIVLHTSLSGVFNSALVEKVGANKFVSKFKAEILSKVVMDRVNDLNK